MNSVIEEIYSEGVVRDEIGNEYKLHSNVDKIEGEFIYQLICSDPGVRKTLEIGCAYGLSSLHICSALYKRDYVKHTIIDPSQHNNWHGVGIFNLNRAGFKFF
jgi:predicted O-methyltransferase YrrM